MFSGIFQAMARLARSFEAMAEQMERMSANVAKANDAVETKLTPEEQLEFRDLGEDKAPPPAAESNGRRKAASNAR